MGSWWLLGAPTPHVLGVSGARVGFPAAMPLDHRGPRHSVAVSIDP